MLESHWCAIIVHCKQEWLFKTIAMLNEHRIVIRISFEMAKRRDEKKEVLLFSSL